MINRNTPKLITCTAIALMLCAGWVHADTGPKYKADVPASVMTPDTVKTDLLGILEFFDGMPTDATVSKTYDFIDTSRAAETFLNGMPAASVYAAMEGLKQAGVKPGELGITENLADARTLLLTPNSTTIYCLAEIDVKGGPMVVEIPPMILGPVDDAFFRFVTDVGFTGPDQGNGGKYLFVHRDYKGQVPDGYFVVKTPSYRNIMFFRAIPKGGDLKTAVDSVKATYKFYPLSAAANPPAPVFHNLSGVKFNTIHANDAHFFNELNAVIQYEPADSFNPELVGLFASIGIKKGQPFNPDARMKKILAEGAAIGNATARSITFANRKKSVYFYPDRQWSSAFAGGSHEFMNDGELVLDDRIFFHYYATGITPAMAQSQPGKGSAYACAFRDNTGQYLDGGKTYKVTLPAPIPAKDFWSFMVYSGQHRSMLETNQKLAGLDSLSPKVKPNADGSHTIWFGPKSPAGKEDNWIQTMPGKSFNVVLRLYGPMEPWFGKTWKPDDLELVK